MQHLRRSFFFENSYSLKPLSVFAKSSPVDVQQGSKNASAKQPLELVVKRKIKTMELR